jgi:uncharacterized RDD family membrane protein YckC
MISSPLLTHPGMWSRRVAAQLLDLAIVAGIGSVIIAVAGDHPYWHFGHLSDEELGVRYLAAAVATFIYVPASLALSGGRTAGKFLLRIAVVRQDGGAIGFWRAAWREVVIKIVLVDAVAWLPTIGASLAFVIIVADVLWPLWSPDGMALHDLAARTRVVRSPMRVRDAAPHTEPPRASSEANP